MAKESVVLNAEVRGQVGSKVTQKIRQQGKMPAVIYGHKKETVSIVIDGHKFTETLRRGHRLLDIEIDGKAEKLLVKALQYDHLGKDIIHADLMRVDLAEIVKISVPLTLKGIAEGTKEGGIIDEQLNEVEVECSVVDIPEAIEVSIKEIDIGDMIHAKDVILPAGVKLITDPEVLILSCHLVAAAKSTEELEEEVPTAPEVITEKKEESEGSSD